MMLEIFTIFIPCWQVLRHQALRQETLDAIASWEKKKSASVVRGSLAPSSKNLSSIERGGSLHTTTSDKSYLMMEALEYVLERNPGPLQEFSALQDFSGENIAFLRSLAEWKAAVAADKSSHRGWNDRQLVRERFNSALRIYAEFISPLDAEFPINLSWKDLKQLEATFESAARAMNGSRESVDVVRPFETPDWHSQMAGRSPSFEKPVLSQSASAGSNTTLEEMKLTYWGEIPESFHGAIFDDAEMNIKYLVLTNTWPKFVKTRRSIESLRVRGPHDSWLAQAVAGCRALIGVPARAGRRHQETGRTALDNPLT